MNTSEFDICELLIQCILGYDALLDEKNIDLQLNIPEGLLIQSDPGLLKIVVNNILSNALKFTPSDGIIKIDLIRKATCTSISFEDNGCGMDEETLRHIFDKFYQGDTSAPLSSPVRSGTGVLTVVSYLQNPVSQVYTIVISFYVF